MKILVTGATGFLGTHVIEALLAEGHTVIATSSNETKARNFAWFDKVKYVEYRIQTKEPEGDLFAYFKQPEAVIHLAWQGLPNYRSFSHIDMSLVANFFFLKNLVTNGLSSLTVTGTCLEYGLQEGELSDDSLTNPTVPYAIAKDCLNKMMTALAKEMRIQYKWLRLFYMYGRGQNPNSLLASLSTAMANGSKSFNLSGGEQVRDFSPVEQIAAAIAEIATKCKIAGNINCCSGKPVSVKRFVESYVKTHHSDIHLNFGYHPYPDYEPMQFWGNTKKMKEATGADQPVFINKSTNEQI